VLAFKRPSILASFLAGSYIAVKGGMYVKVLLSVVVAARIALLGRQPYGKKLPKEVSLEQRALSLSMPKPRQI
jgi:hypothetical protein